MEDLVGMLIKGRVAHRLLDFMPPTKRTLADFNEHFKVGVCMGGGGASGCAHTPVSSKFRF